jgi:prepilin-type N-terminal cleavage/methylation domain-containing protein
LAVPPVPRARAGFTLIELAVALFIITLIMGALIAPLSQQIENRAVSSTQRSIDQAVEALYGFAMTNGRLPCPASAVSNGVEDPPGGGICNFPYNGFLPAVTLGLSPTDLNGYVVDGWNYASLATPGASRIRYAVATSQITVSAGTCLSGVNIYTTNSGMRNCWAQIATSAPPANVVANLSVCSTATGISGTACANAATTLTNKAVAVIYSVGANAISTSGSGIDEAANPNPINGSVDRTFVWHDRSLSTAANGEFDDVMVWISPNVLVSRMISAAQLP